MCHMCRLSLHRSHGGESIQKKIMYGEYRKVGEADRLVARDRKAMKRPSAETEPTNDSPLASVPSEATEIRATVAASLSGNEHMAESLAVSVDALRPKSLMETSVPSVL